jgi:hypothetical protein
VTYTAPAAVAAAVADFSGDGSPDVAALDASSITIYRGPFSNGADWDTMEKYDAPAGAADIAAGDMDGNGSIDIIVAGDGLTIIDRTSGGSTSVLSSVDLSSVQTLDVDGDSIRDIFAAGKNGSVLLRGIGGARYESPVAFAGDVRHAAADFNGDGDEDIVLAAGSTIDICDWNSLGSILTLTVTGATVTDVVTADVDGDGHSDIVAGLSTGGTTVFYGDGALGFTLPSIAATTSAASSLSAPGAAVDRAAVADLDGDGARDIACATTSPAIEARMAAGASRSYALAARARDLECADLDGDGFYDLVVVTDSLAIIRGTR